MTIDSESSSYEYPSLQSARLFWEKAQEEYESDDIISQKNGCEKAYRAATEAVDVLLASNGYHVPVGKPEAHLKRSEYLVTLIDLNPLIRTINSDYSTYKDQLHGICFYTAANPRKYKKIFYSIKEFIQRIKELIEE